MIYVPNLITLLRICAVPVVVWLILNSAFDVAFWIFAAAGVSDAIDGYIAKHFNAETKLGGYLDPIADKALLVCVYVTLGHVGALPVWLVILVVFRDVLIVGGAIVFETVTRALTMEPQMISKINTVAQILLAGVVLGGLGLTIDVADATQFLVYGVVASTLASGGVYVVMWTRRAHVFEQEHSDDHDN